MENRELSYQLSRSRSKTSATGHCVASRRDGYRKRLGDELAENRAVSARKPINVVVVALPSAGLMNLFGPAEVFARANTLSGEPLYRVRIISAASQQYDTAFQVTLTVDATIKDFREDIDTLLVAGGVTWQVPVREPESADLLEWLRAQCGRARRFGAFCSGGMLLAEAGLLHHKQATTHWSRIEEMAARYPGVQVLSDRIYVKDGNCYTSAGGTTAIDLALSLVEEDLGTEMALEVAKHIVLFIRRSGDQPQLSTTLLAQISPVGSINNLLIWMADHLAEDLSVSKLAHRLAMSPRNFARNFLRHVGKTPGRHVSDLRLEAARRNLAYDSMSLSEVAKASGFGSVEVFRRLFTKKFGTSPGRYRTRSQRPALELESLQSPRVADYKPTFSAQ
jgi:transcriptional regulator GlxA family with amidase domain